VIVDWHCQFPESGAWRLSLDPAHLPRRPRFEEGEGPLNRFDDPAGQYLVRYAATSLRACCLEVLSHSFRTRPQLEERLLAVSNAEARPGDLVDLEGKEMEGPGRVPEGWLLQQRAGRCEIAASAAFTNVVSARFLALYNKQPKIRRAIERHLGEAYDLDAGTIMLNLELGRPVTQAVSAVLWSEDPQPAGIRYLSRLDVSEECWAIYNHVAVAFREIQPLSLDRHKQTVQESAEILDLELPDSWI
jgi:hypothetical protein